MTALVGHEAVWREWRAARGGSRMHHGWMLVGREGLGKALFARAAAADLVAMPGVPQPEPEVHPDILWLSPLPASDEDARKRDDGKPFALKRSISVDQVRAMQRRLVTRPTLGPCRAVIIDSADLLEKSAANALLKTLEEPPAGTFLLLVAHQPGRILPTIRSRCRVLRFRPLDAEEMAGVLDRQHSQFDPINRSAAIAVGDGAPGAAIAFAEQDLGPAWALMTRIVREGDPGLALRSALVAAVGGRPDRERMAALLTAARRVLMATIGEGGAARHAALADAHHTLTQLAREAVTHNFDTGALLMEIGALLAGVAPIRDGAQVNPGATRP